MAQGLPAIYGPGREPVVTTVSGQNNGIKVTRILHRKQKGMAEQDSILQICRTEAWQDLSISE